MDHRDTAEAPASGLAMHRVGIANLFSGVVCELVWLYLGAGFNGSISGPAPEALACACLTCPGPHLGILHVYSEWGAQRICISNTILGDAGPAGS